jgi:hypothetical protein
MRCVICVCHVVDGLQIPTVGFQRYEIRMDNEMLEILRRNIEECEYWEILEHRLRATIVKHHQTITHY